MVWFLKSKSSNINQNNCYQIFLSLPIAGVSGGDPGQSGAVPLLLRPGAQLPPAARAGGGAAHRGLLPGLHYSAQTLQSETSAQILGSEQYVCILI